MTQQRPTGNTTAHNVRVLLADDHEICRGGVRSMLKHTEFRVVGEASTGSETLEVASQVQPDLVLLDIRMSGGDGLDTLRVLKQAYPRIAVVMLTTYDNPTYMARAVAGGAAGYLLKGISRPVLLDSLRAVANGEMLMTPGSLLYSLRGISVQSVATEDLSEPLTKREDEVLRLLATGLTNREIGGLLFRRRSGLRDMA
jgi:DNA-binding NarL/FixJ family response regulator